MPMRFDIAQFILEDLRVRIRQALLTDRMGPIGGDQMTATEVRERSAEMALLLGATYWRLQSELMQEPNSKMCIAANEAGAADAPKMEGKE